jgi:hypothetical protein
MLLRSAIATLFATLSILNINHPQEIVSLRRS